MIRILTDSASDILPAEAEQLGVTVIPLNVTLEDGTVLRDGIDMTPSEYYTHLAACRKLPTTSQPSPEQFERLYLDAAAAGDEVLGIFLSDALSGTGQCARLAADLANVDNVVFVNTENVCLGQSLLVRLAVQRPCKQHAPAAQRKQPGVRSANPKVQPHLARMRARDMVWLPVLRRAQARLRPVHAGVLPRR